MSAPAALVTMVQQPGTLFATPSAAVSGGAAALAFTAATSPRATEPHIIHQMEKAAPLKNFIGAPGADGNCNCNVCPYMALNTLEKLYLALRDLTPGRGGNHVDLGCRVTPV